MLPDMAAEPLPEGETQPCEPSVALDFAAAVDESQKQTEDEVQTAEAEAAPARKAPAAKAKAKAKARPETAAGKAKAKTAKLAEAKAKSAKKQQDENQAAFKKAVAAGTADKKDEVHEGKRKSGGKQAPEKRRPASQKAAAGDTADQKDEGKEKSKGKGKSKAKDKKREAPETAEGDAQPKPKKTKSGKADENAGSDPKPEKKKTAKERAELLKTWAEEQPQEDEAVEDAAEASDSEESPALRDASKKRFFRQRKHELPQALLKVFESSNRKEQTQLLNDFVKRDKKGRFSLNYESQYLKAKLQRFSETAGKEKSRGVTETVAAKKCGGEDKLRRAVDLGEVAVVTERGRRFYVFQDFAAPALPALPAAARCFLARGLSRASSEVQEFHVPVWLLHACRRSASRRRKASATSTAWTWSRTCASPALATPSRTTWLAGTCT